MSAERVQEHQPEHHGDERADEAAPTPLSVAPDVVEVRRNGALAGVLGVVAAGVAIAYLSRASATGATLDMLLTLVMALIAGYWLTMFADARTPLLVADAQGVRIRLGRSWRGLPWSAVHHVEHTPRPAWWRDGRVVVVPHNTEKLLAELDAGAARQARIATRLHGGPFALPLGLSTRVVGETDDLGASLATFAAASPVVVVQPEPASAATVEATADEVADVPAADEAHDTPQPRLRDPRPLLASGITRIAAVIGRRDEQVTDEAAEVEPSEAAEAPETAEELPGEPTRPWSAAELRDAVAAPVAPGRDVRHGVRSEQLLDSVARSSEGADEPQGRELREPGRVTLVAESRHHAELDQTAVRGVTPISRAGDPVEPLVVAPEAAEPAEDPVIGPEIAAARTRLGLSVDSVAERTRIRPHVIEAIEVDDFTACGGDFYARGHLRTLARILGIAAEPLVATFDERYAGAPINPRRVFEAELATTTGGSIRGTRGGPNWSVLVAVVMAVVLAWSVASLVMDSRQDGPVEQVTGSGGPHANTQVAGDPVPVTVTAAKGGARVVVRDGNGDVVWQGNLAIGETHSVKAVPPVRVQSTDGATTVKVAGKDRGAIGEAGVAAQGTYVAR